MTRYKVKTSYPHPGTPRTVGYEFDTTRDVECMDYSDQVALQAGFLEEVKEPEHTKLEYELAGVLSTQGPMQHYHPEMCLPLAKAALTYLRSRMPKQGGMGTDWYEGYNKAIFDVLRDVFGETDCKGDSK